MDWNQLGERFIDRLFDPITITAIGAAIGGILLSIRNSRKIDENTKITQRIGTESLRKIDSSAIETKNAAAQSAAKVAKIAESECKAQNETLEVIKATTQEIAKTVNGPTERRFLAIEQKLEAILRRLDESPNTVRFQ